MNIKSKHGRWYRKTSQAQAKSLKNLVSLQIPLRPRPNNGMRLAVLLELTSHVNGGMFARVHDFHLWKSSRVSFVLAPAMQSTPWSLNKELGFKLNWIDGKLFVASLYFVLPRFSFTAHEVQRLQCVFANAYYYAQLNKVKPVNLNNI